VTTPDTNEATFSFGPTYARDTGCCGKPVGCSNTGEECLHRNHQWKLSNIPGHAETMASEHEATAVTAPAPEPRETRKGTILSRTANRPHACPTPMRFWWRRLGEGAPWRCGECGQTGQV
jgi:hypothetical protein